MITHTPHNTYISTTLLHVKKSPCNMYFIHSTISYVTLTMLSSYHYMNIVHVRENAAHSTP